MPENIETKVAQTILQQPEEITVGDKVYKAAPPSAATLILASEAVARMPKFNSTRNESWTRYWQSVKIAGLWAKSSPL